MYHQVRSGEFSGVDFLGSGTCEIKIASLYHLPASLTVKATQSHQPNKEVGVIGQILLRRPPVSQRSQLEVTLHKTDGTPVNDWNFMLGAVTFGGVYGGNRPSRSDGVVKIDDLAPQNVQIGFNERTHYKERTMLELKPGMLARVRYKLDGDTLIVPPEVEYVNVRP